MRVGSRPLSGPPEVSSHGREDRGVRDGGLDQTRVAERLAGSRETDGIWAPQACQTERDIAQGRTAPNGHVRASPPPSMATPFASLRSASRAAGPPPASTYAARPSIASDVASPPSAISQAGVRLPSMEW